MRPTSVTTPERILPRRGRWACARCASRERSRRVMVGSPPGSRPKRIWSLTICARRWSFSHERDRHQRSADRARAASVRHRRGIGQPQRQAGAGDEYRACGQDGRRRRREAPDLHARHDHPKERLAAVSSRRHGVVGEPRPLLALPGGLHALGVARAAQGAGRRTRAHIVFHAVRSDRGRFPRETRGAGLQDRVVRTGRPPAHSEGGEDRQAADPLHRHGHDRGDRRGGERVPHGGRQGTRAAQVHQRVSVAAGGASA